MDIFVKQNLVWLILAVMGWVVLSDIVSALYRLRKGMPIFARVPERALIAERWVSGRIGTWGMAKASGCLMVAITKESLIVCPHFPFTLMYAPEELWFECTIPRHAIRTVRLEEGVFRSAIRVDFDRPGGVKTIRLFLRRPEDFFKVLQPWWAENQSDFQKTDEQSDF